MVLRALLTMAFLRCAVALVPVSPGMRSFGSVIKGGRLIGGNEKVVFEHNVTSDGSNGVVVQQWFAGPYISDPNVRVRYYLDGEVEPSIDMTLAMAHGVGPSKAQNNGHNEPITPWASKRWSHSADLAFVNSIRIPFQRTIRVTITVAENIGFYYMLRGVENYPIALGDLLLPPTSKLRLHSKMVNVTERQQFTAVSAQVGPGGKGGALLASGWLVYSATTRFQEGCVRALIDGRDPMFLSSGFEDYFLVAYFHNPFTKAHLPDAGFERNASDIGGDGNSVQGYRIHETDPLLFTESLELQWETPMSNGRECQCPKSWPPPTTFPPPEPVPNKDPVFVHSYAWVYTW